MNTSRTGTGTHAVPPEEMPPPSPVQLLRAKINVITDALGRARDATAVEYGINTKYVAVQLHNAYVELLNAIIIDIDEPIDDGEEEPSTESINRFATLCGDLAQKLREQEARKGGAA